MLKGSAATAELEVEAHERVIENAVSLHKVAGSPFTWEDYLKVIDPYPFVVEDVIEASDDLTPARMRSLARRVLLGDPAGYIEALRELSPLSSIQQLGTTVEVEAEHRSLISGRLVVNDRGVIPKESKTLTATGKVSTKAMAKGRYHELYQDHVCSCVLRVAREMFALLPIETVIITAVVRGVDSGTGKDTLIPVLSVAVTRNKLRELDFERLDPSDSMVNFLHRGDVLASKRTGEFKAIEPLTASDVMNRSATAKPLRELVSVVRTMRSEIERISRRIPSSRGSTSDVAP